MTLTHCDFVHKFNWPTFHHLYWRGVYTDVQKITDELCAAYRA